MATKPTEAQKAAVVQKALAQKAAANTLSKKVNTVQTTLSSSGLGAATKAAQQALSEKYGIPTFDIEGKISTVPTTRPLDPTINVGTGALTQSAFNQSLNLLIRQQQQQTTGGGISLASITAPITGLIETLFPKQDLSDLDDNQRKAIQGIEDEIKVQQEIVKKYSAGANQGSFSDITYVQQANAKIDELTRTRNDVLRRYRSSNSLVKEIQQQQQELQKLNKTQDITEQLKEEINLAVKEASGLLEKMVREGLEIPKDIIKQFNATILESTKVLQKTIDKEQSDIDKKLQDAQNALNPFAFIVEAFNLIFNPPKDVKIERMVEDARAQVEAVKRLNQK